MTTGVALCKRSLESSSNDVGESSQGRRDEKPRLADRNQGYEGSSEHDSGDKRQRMQQPIEMNEGEENLKQAHKKLFEKFTTIKGRIELQETEVTYLIDELTEESLEALEKKCAINISEDRSYNDRYKHLQRLYKEGLEYFRLHIDGEEVEGYATDYKYLQEEISDCNIKCGEYKIMLQKYKDGKALDNALRGLENLKFDSGDFNMSENT